MVKKLNFEKAKQNETSVEKTAAQSPTSPASTVSTETQATTLQEKPVTTPICICGWYSIVSRNDQNSGCTYASGPCEQKNRDAMNCPVTTPVTPATPANTTTPAEHPKDVITTVQDEMTPKPPIKPTGVKTAVFKDGIIPSVPGNQIIVANANLFRHKEEHDPVPTPVKAIISGDDNKILRGN